MTIQEVIDQLQYEEDKTALHELAWRLVNLTRLEGGEDDDN